MTHLLKLELKKAIFNKFFYIAIVIGVIISFLGIENLLHTSSELTKHLEYAKANNTNPYWEIFTVFNNWIGGTFHSFVSFLFYFIAPVLIAIPFCWSYVSERKTKYISQEIVRSGKYQYTYAKYIATFISGGLTILIPQIINILVTMLFVPVITPSLCYQPENAVYADHMFASLFYSNPWLFTLNYLLIGFFFCGSIAGLTMVTGKFIKFKWLNCTIPFVFCYALSILSKILFTPTPGKRLYTISPFEFLNAKSRYQCSFPAILIIISSITIFSLFIINITEKKHEIY